MMHAILHPLDPPVAFSGAHALLLGASDTFRSVFECWVGPWYNTTGCATVDPSERGPKAQTAGCGGPDVTQGWSKASEGVSLRVNVTVVMGLPLLASIDPDTTCNMVQGKAVAVCT